VDGLSGNDPGQDIALKPKNNERMRTKPFILLAIGVLSLALVVLLRSGSKPGTAITAPMRTASAMSPTSDIRRDATSTNNSRGMLQDIAANVSMTATGAVAGYEVRQIIAEHLRTNEPFLRWATNTVTSAVTKLATNANIPIYGARGLTPGKLQVSVDVKPVGGLYAEAVYDPDTNSEGPLSFGVEGGTNPLIVLVQNQYRMSSYQLDPQSWGSQQYPRNVGRMDWAGATAPLDATQVEAVARQAYFAMTANEVPPTLVAKIDISPTTDPRVQDPSVKVIGKQGATVATVNNQRYPFAIFQFGEPGTLNQPFSGEMVQTEPGQAQVVNLVLAANLRGAVLELGDQFLGASSENWAQEVLSSVGSTPPEDVLRKMWRIPNR